MAAPYTYSFLDTLAAINGPGGSFNIGAGAGIDEGGITIEPSQEIDGMVIGADGEGMHSLYADRSAKVTIRCLKNSPTNSFLQSMLNLQRASAANHGQNNISVSNVTSGDSHQLALVAFAKQPVITYAKDGGMNEWAFNAIKWTPALGAGVSA